MARASSLDQYIASVAAAATPAPTSAPAPPDDPANPDTFEYAAHGIDLASAARHAVARCRWCGGGFVLMRGAHWICSSLACARKQLAYAIRRRGAVFPNQTPWFFVPLPMQVDIEAVAMAKYKHSLIAGAAGTAKSVGSRFLVYRYSQLIPGLRSILIRTTYDELLKNHLQFMPAEASQLGADYTGGNVRQMTFHHQDGPDSIVFAGSCLNEADIAQYVGPEYDLILLDEGVHLLPRAVREIIARARGSATSVEAKLRLGMPAKWARSVVISNPGGRAMMFLVDAYIRKHMDQTRFPKYNPARFGHLGSTLDDNPYLDEDYESENLSHLEASRYRQLRHGDWTAISGAFFNFTDAHVVA